MNDNEQLAVLIGDIYDAALDPAQRADVLEKIVAKIPVGRLGQAQEIVSRSLGGK